VYVLKTEGAVAFLAEEMDVSIIVALGIVAQAEFVAGAVATVLDAP